MTDTSNVKVYFGGGSNTIGNSFTMLVFDNKYYLGMDWGGGYDSPLSQPRYSGSLDWLFISHAHLDHCMQVPRLAKSRGNLQIFATAPTLDLSKIGWGQAINLLRRKGEQLPFNETDIDATANRTKIIKFEKEIRLAEDLSVFPISSGHILGSISLLVVYKKEVFFLTSDICFQDRFFIKKAPKIELERSRLLVREATYISDDFTPRQDVIDFFIKSLREKIAGGGRVLIPALSIDRMQDIYAITHQAGLPVFLDGSTATTDVYVKHIPGAEFLSGAKRFENYEDRNEFLRSGKPGVIIASSGMVHEGSTSAFWAVKFSPNPKDSLFMVNYQDPEGQGSKFINTKKDGYLFMGRRIVKRACDVQSFNFSAHMSGKDGELLENSLNPDTVIYCHGNDKKIDTFLSNAPNDRRRIKARTNKFVEV